MGIVDWAAGATGATKIKRRNHPKGLKKDYARENDVPMKRGQGHGLRPVIRE